MPKIRALLIEPLPVDHALVKQALEIASGEIELVSAPSFSAAQGSADIIIAAFPTAKAIEELLAKRNQLVPATLLIGLGRGSLEHGEVIAEDEWVPMRLSSAFRAAMRIHKLQSENRQLRGDLLTTARRLSHDLRSPLGCIHTNADMIKELGPDALDEEALHESAGLILDSAKEATALINRIALVLRASAELPKLEPIDSGMAFKDALNALHLPLSALSAPETWPRVLAVQPWLTAIWTNLIDNAVRHGGPGAKIRIDWEEKSGCIHFSVTDNGPGVPSQQLPTLFRPFEQLHLAHSGGLGLSIVNRLVILLGGTCAHVRPPEGGASFEFTLTGIA